MFLSDEQTRAATHGLTPAPKYEWVEVPEGPREIPSWARGLEISWMDGFGNPPHYTVKVSAPVRDWPVPKIYRKEGSRYLAESGDGRASCFYSRSEPTLQRLRRRVWSHVGMMPAFETILRSTSQTWRFSQGRYYWDQTYEAWATDHDEGFGGHCFDVRLDDGRDVILRGPWHGQSPDGYQDVGSSRCEAFLISEDVLLLLIARYYPTVRVARVRGKIQAVREDWLEPKEFERERRRAESRR